MRITSAMILKRPATTIAGEDIFDPPAGAHPMKRSELYKSVWSSPMSQLSKELKLSDVGLAKLCRRNGIPVPPRGYWARLKAGHTSPKVALPKRENDFEIHIPQSSERASARQRPPLTAPEQAAQDSVARLDYRIEMPPDLEQAHKLIAVTASYCKRLPTIIQRYERTRASERWTPHLDHPPHEHFGRLNFHHAAEGLDIQAALNAMDWVLRFHHAIFAPLKIHGVVFRRERKENPGPTQVVADLDGEKLQLSFSQGYSKQLAEVTKRSDERRGFGGENSPRYTAVDRMNFKVEGEQYHLRKTWTGSRQQLEGQLTEIVNACLELFAHQPIVRKEQQDEARRRELEAHRRARVQWKLDAQAKQLEVALKAANALDAKRQLERFLDLVTEQVDSLEEPSRTRARVWLETVRQQQRRVDPVAELLQRVSDGYQWQYGAPDWWPDDPLKAD